MKNMLSKKKRECKQCGDCCRYILLWLPHDANKDYLRWIGYHEGMRVISFKKGINAGFKAIRIDSPCSKLTKDGKCSVYKTRPDVCFRYNCWDGMYPKPHH